MQRKRMLIVTSDDLNHSHINNDLSGVNHLVDFHFCDYKGVQNFVTGNECFHLAMVYCRQFNQNCFTHVLSVFHKMGIPFILAANENISLRSIETAIPMRPALILVEPISATELLANIKLLLQRFSDASLYTVKVGRKFYQFPQNQIQYVKSEKNYTEINTDNKRYVVRQSTRTVLASLSLEMVQIHRAYYVNVTSILEVNQNLILTGGAQLPVSRTYKSAVIDKIKNV